MGRASAPMPFTAASLTSVQSENSLQLTSAAEALLETEDGGPPPLEPVRSDAGAAGTAAGAKVRAIVQSQPPPPLAPLPSTAFAGDRRHRKLIKNSICSDYTDSSDDDTAAAQRPNAREALAQHVDQTCVPQVGANMNDDSDHASAAPSSATVNRTHYDAFTSALASAGSDSSDARDRKSVV